jgi:hypothetical protein
MNTYERFLAFDIVINITTPEEYAAFVKRCEDLKLDSIKYIKRISFDDLHKNAGIRVIKYGDVCMEYQPTKGFTFDKKVNYEDYGVEIISVEEFLEATK